VWGRRGFLERKRLGAKNKFPGTIKGPALDKENKAAEGNVEQVGPLRMKRKSLLKGTRWNKQSKTHSRTQGLIAWEEAGEGEKRL